MGGAAGKWAGSEGAVGLWEERERLWVGFVGGADQSVAFEGGAVLVGGAERRWAGLGNPWAEPDHVADQWAGFGQWAEPEGAAGQWEGLEDVVAVQVGGVEGKWAGLEGGAGQDRVVGVGGAMVRPRLPVGGAG